MYFLPQVGHARPCERVHYFRSTSSLSIRKPIHLHPRLYQFSNLIHSVTLVLMLHYNILSVTISLSA